MLYLGYVLLRLYVLNCAVKTVFYPTLGYFLRTPDNSNLFSISLEGSSYQESTVLLILVLLSYDNHMPLRTAQ